jgi:hypothetical protein
MTDTVESYILLTRIASALRPLHKDLGKEAFVV